MYFNVHIETDDAAVKARTAAAPLVVSMSKVSTVGKCLEQICAAWQLPADKVRLWDYYKSERYNLLADHAASLASVPLYTGQSILVEQQKADGSWPFAEDSGQSGAGAMDLFDGAGSTSATSSASATGAGPSGSSSRAVTTLGTGRLDTVVDTSTPQQLGVVGLSNLGNTCFMNSMLQCLSNLEALRRFFVSGDFEQELNPDNPLGAEVEHQKQVIARMWLRSWNRANDMNRNKAIDRNKKLAFSTIRSDGTSTKTSTSFSTGTCSKKECVCAGISSPQHASAGRLSSLILLHACMLSRSNTFAEPGRPALDQSKGCWPQMQEAPAV